MYRGTEKVDLHGKNKYQARIALDAVLRRVRRGVYRVQVIHGYHYGTELRDMVREGYRDHPKVLRVEDGSNDGETILILRERF